MTLSNEEMLMSVKKLAILLGYTLMPTAVMAQLVEQDA